MSALRGLRVIIWKNYVLRKRHFILTATEIVIPTLLFMLFAYARSETDLLSKEFVNETTFNDPFPAADLYTKLNLHETKLYYAPKTPFTEELIDKARLKLHIFQEAIKSFDTETDLDKYYKSNGLNDTILAVVFELSDSISGSIPKRLSYKIRTHHEHITWNTEKLYHTSLSYVPGMGSETYINKGFLPLQMAVDAAFLEMLGIKVPKLTFEEFPYPPHFEDDGIMDLYMYVLPLITMFGFVLLVPAVLRRIIEEKSTGIKQLMKMMGLESRTLWFGWFFHAFIVNLTSVIIIIILLKTRIWGHYPPIEFCDGFIMFVFLLLYCIASISFCFFISTFFSKPNIAVVFGVIFWLLSYFVPSGIFNNHENINWFIKILASFIPNMSLDFGYKALAVYELREVGVQWSNINKAPSGSKNDLTMLHVLIMLLVDSIVYMILTMYMDNIKPGPYGIAKPWHYPLNKLIRKIRRCNEVNDKPEELRSFSENENVERSNLVPGIKIRKLHKSYGKKSAVNDLNMDIYEDEITVLLGHNGAGKTTTMSILTGMIRASHGKIFIKGTDIEKNIDSIKSLIGICPQHNLLFTDLNVFEHLKFFAMLKGVPQENIDRNCNELLNTLGLAEKKFEMVNCLSGGMKRKVCLGMALVGNPQVLVLDEPTSGLDVEARRDIWNILLKSREKKTVIITTHFMEEADELGDRIAIMDHGNLICYGTPFFLKEKYSTGYQLFLNCVEACDKGAIKREVGKFIESYKCEDSANELKLTLPFKDKKQYVNLLEELESKQEALGIHKIALSVTRAEDIFLKARHISADESNSALNCDEDFCHIFNCQSMTATAKLRALFAKRFAVFKVRKLQFLMHLAIALISVWLTLYLGLSAHFFEADAENSLNLTLKPYGPSGVYYSASPSLNLSSYYEEIAKSQLGSPVRVGNVNEAVVSAAGENIEYYKQHIIVGAELQSSEQTGELSANILYSNMALHGAPISLNMFLNAYLKSMAGPDYSISTANSPLQGFAEPSTVQNQSAIQNGLFWLSMFPLGAYIMISAFLAFPQLEYKNNIKQLQSLAGVKSYIYWYSCFIFDYFLYLIYLSLVICTFALYACIGDTFSGLSELEAIFTILFCYGLCAIPYIYLFSRSKTTSSGLAAFLISSLAMGLVLTNVVLFLEMSISKAHIRQGRILRVAFSLFPQFALTYASVTFSVQAVWNYNWRLKTFAQKMHTCSLDLDNPCCNEILGMGINGKAECAAHMSYFAQIYDILICMLVSAVIYTALLLFLDSVYCKRLVDRGRRTHYQLLRKARQFLKRNGKLVEERLEEITSHKSKKKGEGEFHYKADSLKKIYRDNYVVNGVTFTVGKGECFGLLGVNGAGKTSTFKMLTGEERINVGNAYLNIPVDHRQKRISVDEDEYNTKLGYCPQFDALNYDLTAEELLKCFAVLRGVTDDKCVPNLITQLGLDEYKNVRCGMYSGGNKRKLNIALALIGNPLISLLDEPTTGVDPASKRQIWNIIKRYKSTKISDYEDSEVKPLVILSSHSMDECEALCDNLAIMKQGHIKCEGPIIDLKEQYGSGRTIKVKLRDGKDGAETAKDEFDGMARNVKNTIQSKFGDKLTLIDEHNLSLHYHLKDTSMRWSGLFKELEDLVQTGLIEDYNISQATLEDVFLNVAGAVENNI